MASPASTASDGPEESPAQGRSSPAFDGGLSWCWDLDVAALLDAVSGPAPWRRPQNQGPCAGSETDAADDPEADEAAYQEAVAAGRVRDVPLECVAGRIAESLPTGPGLAGWLAQSRAADLEDGALAGIAASFRRLASWATAGELMTVAQIASRSAGADHRAEIDAAGRPDRVTADAAGQVSLALAMSHDGATSWADLGVMLTWRLPATGAALAAGEIDLARARMIVRMTSPLSDEAARQVEAAVLGRAGWMTLGQLHVALRRAIIKADPQGAERRRQQAERNASVAFYPEDEGTATLAGYSLPGTEAAAAMARITALARAMKVAGSDGQIDMLRAHVFLGLLLGTLPPRPLKDVEIDPRGDGPPADTPPAGSPGPWPEIRPYLPSWLPDDADRAQAAGPAGLLNLAAPLATLSGESSSPGHLSWLGVVTASQARQLAVLAARHTATRWRVVVVNAAGQAIAVRHVPRSRSPGKRDGPGLIKRVTLVVGGDALAHGPPPGRPPGRNSAGGALGAIIDRALVAAARAAEDAREREARDRQYRGCAHDLASPAYRPPPRVTELVTARDGTCRFPPCRRPAEQCDLDHTVPFDKGGLTCPCNLGGECRSHHQLKQHRRWSLRQRRTGCSSG